MSLLVVALALLTVLALLQWERLSLALRRAQAAASDPRVFEQRPPQPRQRVLVLGDSTGVGVGAGDPARSVAGLLGSDRPDAEVVNRCRAGARLQDVWDQLPDLPADRFDLVLLHVGGNDVLRHTSRPELAAQADALMARLRGLAPRVLWLSTANIGLAPVFLPPLSWWFSRRTRAAADCFREAAQRHGAEFISFYRERGADPFSRLPQVYFADDGVHPSAASYRLCYEVVRRRLGLRRRRRAQRASSRGVRTYSPTSMRPARKPASQ